MKISRYQVIVSFFCLNLNGSKISNSVIFTGFYVDCLPPNYCFVPCGHMASEQSVKYWANVPIPCGTSGFQSACPFCAVPLTGNPGYMKLIFQDKCDQLLNSVHLLQIDIAAPHHKLGICSIINICLTQPNPHYLLSINTRSINILPLE